MCAKGGSSGQVEKKGPGEMCWAAAVAMTALRSSAPPLVFLGTMTKGTDAFFFLLLLLFKAGGAASAAGLLRRILTVCVHSSAVVGNAGVGRPSTATASGLGRATV